MPKCPKGKKWSRKEQTCVIKQEKKLEKLEKRGFKKSATTGSGEVQVRKYKKKRGTEETVKVKRKGVTSEGKTKKYATTKPGVDYTTIEMIGKKAYKKIKKNK
tara:strand:+ start:367 stop:675 length:309 start_codon:yes stop_codon:yes gene_type:complete